MDDINLICLGVIAAVLIVHYGLCRKFPRFGSLKQDQGAGTASGTAG